MPSYYYTGYAQGSFKTAYLQRAIPLDVACSTTQELKVGDIFQVSGASKYIVPITSVASYAASSADYGPSAIEAAKALVSNGQYILAQADMTLEYGHVPVEYRDYKYSDVVKLDSSLYSNLSSPKKVMAYPVINLEDIIVGGRYVEEYK